MSDDAQSKTYKVTLKSGESFADPWVTVEGDSEAQLAFALQDLVDKGTFALIGQAAVAFRQGVHNTQTAATVLGGQVQQGGNVQPMQLPGITQVQQTPPPFVPPETPAATFTQGQQQYQPQPGNVVQFPQQGQVQQDQGRGQKLENDFVGKGGHYPPAGPRPVCQHGPRDWKSFQSKAGKLTEMWACPFDRRGAFIPPGETKCDVQWAD